MSKSNILEEANNIVNNRSEEKERQYLSLIHISEPTRRTTISYAVFCL